MGALPVIRQRVSQRVHFSLITGEMPARSFPGIYYGNNPFNFDASATRDIAML